MEKIDTISDMILDGTLCQECGTSIFEDWDQYPDANDIPEELLSPGYPRTCEDCLNDQRKSDRK